MTPKKKPEKGLYMVAYERLKELQTSDDSDVIRFPKVFEKLCSSFSIPKERCWDILFAFRDFGIIEIVKGHGVVVKELD